jgi:hypothetical protein
MPVLHLLDEVIKVIMQLLPVVDDHYLPANPFYPVAGRVGCDREIFGKLLIVSATKYTA